MSEEKNNQFIKNRDRYAMYGLILILFVWVIALTVSFVNHTHDIPEVTIPETEVVETTECTTAPDETTIDILEMTEATEVTETTEVTEITTEPVTIMPTEKETIHIEPTETVSETVEATEATESVAVNGMTEREMLACVIYQEAGGNGSCDECRRRVADVVLNRVADPRFPDTMYEVLTARSQYGRFHWTGIVWPSRAQNAGEKEAVARAYRIADEVLAGQHSDLYGNGYIWQAEFKQGKDNIYCCGHYYGR